MDKILYIVRHGETELNKLRIVQGSGIDSNLNDYGRRQARAFYERYKDVKFDIAICSGLKRTLETIHPFILDGLPYIIKPEFNEISWGDHEGKESSETTIQTYKNIMESWKQGKFEHTVPGGESPIELRKRLHEGLEFIHSLPYQKILICTHGRALRCLLTILNNESMVEMEKYGHKNTCLYMVRLKDGVFHIDTHNNTDHLEDHNLSFKEW